MDVGHARLFVSILGHVCSWIGKVAGPIFERDIDSRTKFAEKIALSAPRRRDEVLECAREILLSSWMNRLFHMRMSKVLSSETIDAEEFWKLFKEKHFIAKSEDFMRKAGRILNRREDDGFPFAGAGSLSVLKESPTYGEDCQQLMRLRYSAEITKWAYAYFFEGKNGLEREDRQAEMLVLGQMDCVQASRLILQTVQAVPVKRVRVRFFGCTSFFENELRRLLPTKEESLMRLGKILSVEFGNKHGLTYFCDIVFICHYWQHRHNDEIACYLENEHTHPCSLNEGGLFVWDSAVSRDPDEDEYVCEGFHSKDVVGLSRKDVLMNQSVISFRPPGTSVKEARRMMVRYDFSVFAKRFGINVYREYPLAIEWSPSPKIDELRVLREVAKIFCTQIGSSLHSFEASSACAVDESLFGDSSYCVLRLTALTKSGSEESWALIAAKGKTCGMSGRSASSERYFVYLAGETKTEERDLSQRGVRQLLNDIGERGSGGVIQLSESRSCGMCAAVVKRAAHEWDGKRYLVVFERLTDGGGKIAYVPLPTRRYLTKSDYDSYLNEARKFDAKKTTVLQSALGRDDIRCFRPVSVTALISYRHLKEAWHRRHLTLLVSEKYGEAFFYKIHHSCDAVSLADLKRAFPSEEQQAVHDLFSANEANVNRDEFFNQLPIEKRLNLLAPMNVHNVFVVAQKDRMTQQDRLKRWAVTTWRQFLKYLLCNVFSFAVDLALMVMSYKWFLLSFCGGVYWAAVVGFAAGLVLSYCTAMWFVFVSSSEHNKVCSIAAFGWFALLGVVGLLMLELGLYFGTEQLQWNYIVVRVLCAPITVVWNFASRKWIISREGR